MEGNFPKSTYNRKSGIVFSKKTVRWIFKGIDQYILIIDSIRKKNQTVRVIGT
jgi:hypothetical protein